MRNLLALVGAAVVLFVGLGWYFHWYSFGIQPGSNGTQRIQLDVDTHKIADDAKKFGDTVGNAVQNVQAKADQTKTQPAELVGPPLPPDLPARGTTAPTPGQLTLPRPGGLRN